MALVGRSNVGKSSLINALVRQPLARTSATPGKTSLANIYRVRRGSMPALATWWISRAMDTRGVRPGEGAATEFRRLTNADFGPAGATGRAAARGFAPSGPRHRIWRRGHGWRSRRARAVVGTKVDKLTQAERVRHAREMETVFEMPVALVSARTGEGLDELWKMIASLPNKTAA